MSLRESGNPYGDLEITEPRAMRALAHPVRLAILSRLQGHGPATATELSEHVDASPSVTSWHLRHLASFGLVRDSDTRSAVTRRAQALLGGGRRAGSGSSSGDDDEGRAASRVLSRHDVRAGRRPARPLARRGRARTSSPQWRRLAGLSNTRRPRHRRELADVEAAIEQVLAPYVTRAARTGRPDARGVRMIRYVLPGAVDDDREDEPSRPRSHPAPTCCASRRSGRSSSATPSRRSATGSPSSRSR